MKNSNSVMNITNNLVAARDLARELETQAIDLQAKMVKNPNLLVRVDDPELAKKLRSTCSFLAQQAAEEGRSWRFIKIVTPSSSSPKPVPTFFSINEKRMAAMEPGQRFWGATLKPIDGVVRQIGDLLGTRIFKGSVATVLGRRFSLVKGDEGDEGQMRGRWVVIDDRTQLGLSDWKTTKKEALAVAKERLSDTEKLKKATEKAENSFGDSGRNVVLLSPFEDLTAKNKTAEVKVLYMNLASPDRPSLEQAALERAIKKAQAKARSEGYRRVRATVRTENYRAFLDLCSSHRAADPESWIFIKVEKKR